MSKVIKKNKGTVSHFDDDSFEFTPYGKGEPVYDHSHIVGDCTLGLTKGAGRQNFIAHLKCKAEGVLDVKRYALRVTALRVTLRPQN